MSEPPFYGKPEDLESVRRDPPVPEQTTAAIAALTAQVRELRRLVRRLLES